jgi:negative regulator of flagellin synthesis FlgM
VGGKTVPDSIRGVSSDPIAATSTIQNVQGGSNTASAAGTEAPAPTNAGADQANVSQTQALLQSILQAANDVPGIDQAKVADLQQALASGAYQIDPQAITQKLVELEGLLTTAGQVQ